MVFTEVTLTRDQKLVSLKMEAQALVQEVESGGNTQREHQIGTVLHVASVAFQFGRLGEIWEGFVAMDELKAVGKEPGKRMYPGLIMNALGEEFLREIGVNRNGLFSVEQVKKIAAISSLIGDMSNKRTIED